MIMMLGGMCGAAVQQWWSGVVVEWCGAHLIQFPVCTHSLTLSLPGLHCFTFFQVLR